MIHTIILQCKLIKYQDMKPTNFPQSVKVLQRPSTMSESECQSLPVWCDGKQCVSCWKPTFAERIKIAIGGNIWLGVMSGNTQPPVFVRASIKARFVAFITQVKESVIEAVNNVKQGFKEPDKRKHFIAGFAISILVSI